MKTFKESVLNFRCDGGCSASIYNATHDYNGKCPECGAQSKTITLLKEKASNAS